MLSESAFVKHVDSDLGYMYMEKLISMHMNFNEWTSSSTVPNLISLIMQKKSKIT